MSYWEHCCFYKTTVPPNYEKFWYNYSHAASKWLPQDTKTLFKKVKIKQDL